MGREDVGQVDMHGRGGLRICGITEQIRDQGGDIRGLPGARTMYL